MLDVTDLKEKIRNGLLGITEITTLVGNRIFFADLFTLINPVFPCINLDLFEGRNVVSSVDRLGLNIYCSSKISYDQADGIYNEVNEYLLNTSISKIVCRAQITPINRLIQSQSPIVYQNISRYLIFYIN